MWGVSMVGLPLMFTSAVNSYLVPLCHVERLIIILSYRMKAIEIFERLLRPRPSLWTLGSLLFFGLPMTRIYR